MAGGPRGCTQNPYRYFWFTSIFNQTGEIVNYPAKVETRSSETRRETTYNVSG
jgi:hypothetical protein